jgi:hypothetical protein
MKALFKKSRLGFFILDVRPFFLPQRTQCRREGRKGGVVKATTLLFSPKPCALCASLRERCGKNWHSSLCQAYLPQTPRQHSFYKKALLVKNAQNKRVLLNRATKYVSLKEQQTHENTQFTFRTFYSAHPIFKQLRLQCHGSQRGSHHGRLGSG